MLGSGIPDKGRVLNQLSAFWFGRTGHIVPNHLISTDVADVSRRARAHSPPSSTGRSMLVRTHDAAARRVRRARLPLGIGLEGLQGDRRGVRHRAAEGPARIGSPARADLHAGHQGRVRPRREHQRRRRPRKVVGAELLARLKTLTLELYAHGVAHAESKGIILADTKFEFGLTDAGELLLIDEMMTPDSSRYWPKDTYAPGGPQPSFDKQYVRDYLESIKWNKQPPVPSLPDRRRRRTRATSTSTRIAA